MFKKILNLTVIICFLSTIIGPICPITCSAADGVILPEPGRMVNLSPSYVPANLIGLQIDSQNPFHIDFLINRAEDQNQGSYNREEYLMMVKYFMGALTVPTKDQWVNLSPYESQRVISGELGFTEMGRDLLSQDYLLKQLTASLMYPEKEIGQKLWKQIYQQVYTKYGADVKIPVNTFNKVWIMPESAVLYEKGNQVWIVKSSMNVMLETDYLAVMKNKGVDLWKASPKDQNSELSAISKDIIRNIIIPVIKKEVNEGKNFAVLRQIYNAMVLATWYKKDLKQSILTKVYGDAKKVKGIDFVEKSTVEKIYQRYLKAYKKGVFNYIKEDIDPVSQETLPRKYFSGGYTNDEMPNIMKASSSLSEISQAMTTEDRRMFNSSTADVAMVSTAFTNVKKWATVGGLLLLTAFSLASPSSAAGGASYHPGLGEGMTAEQTYYVKLIGRHVDAQSINRFNEKVHWKRGLAFDTTHLVHYLNNDLNNNSKNNLGPTTNTRESEEIIAVFQSEHDLSPTGTLDDKTENIADKLEGITLDKGNGVTKISPAAVKAPETVQASEANSFVDEIQNKIHTITPSHYSGEVKAALVNAGYINNTNQIMKNFPGQVSLEDFQAKMGNILKNSNKQGLEVIFNDLIEDSMNPGNISTTSATASAGGGNPPPPDKQRVFLSLAGKSIVPDKGKGKLSGSTAMYPVTASQQAGTTIIGAPKAGITTNSLPKSALKAVEKLAEAVKVVVLSAGLTPEEAASEMRHPSGPVELDHVKTWEHYRAYKNYLDQNPTLRDSPAIMKRTARMERELQEAKVINADGTRVTEPAAVSEFDAAKNQLEATVKVNTVGAVIYITKPVVKAVEKLAEAVKVVVLPAGLTPEEAASEVRHPSGSIELDHDKTWEHYRAYKNYLDQNPTLRDNPTVMKRTARMERELQEAKVINADGTKVIKAAVPSTFDSANEQLKVVLDANPLDSTVNSLPKPVLKAVENLAGAVKVIALPAGLTPEEAASELRHPSGPVELDHNMTWGNYKKYMETLDRNPVLRDNPEVKGITQKLVRELTPGFIKAGIITFDQRKGADKAQASNGGINFDATLLNMQIKRDGHGMPLPINCQNPDLLNIQGLFPVVLSIQMMPVSEIPRL
ncbi:MAG: hypothetical protein HQL12_01570 [Candidatus Omnitrophica bacterium]|nr:hypothetical protein [Candidatus Omnitrophota bacterium]